MEESIGEARKETKSESINKIINDNSTAVINSDSEVRAFSLEIKWLCVVPDNFRSQVGWTAKICLKSISN